MFQRPNARCALVRGRDHQAHDDSRVCGFTATVATNYDPCKPGITKPRYRLFQHDYPRGYRL